MRELHRFADIEEQVEARRQRQPAARAPGVDGLALDELHREPERTLGRAAAVEQAPDVRMGEVGQDLALVAEQLLGDVVLGIGAHQLERDLLFELAVGAPAQVDHRHAAATEFALHREGPDALARRVLARGQRDAAHETVEQRTLEGAGRSQEGGIDRHHCPGVV